MSIDQAAEEPKVDFMNMVLPVATMLNDTIPSMNSVLVKMDYTLSLISPMISNETIPPMYPMPVILNNTVSPTREPGDVVLTKFDDNVNGSISNANNPLVSFLGGLVIGIVLGFIISHLFPWKKEEAGEDDSAV